MSKNLYIIHQGEFHLVEAALYGDGSQIVEARTIIGHDLWFISHDKNRDGIKFSRLDVDGGFAEANLDKVLVWR